MAAEILGVVFARHVIRVLELASASVGDLVDVISPVPQRYLTEPLC